MWQKQVPAWSGGRVFQVSPVLPCRFSSWGTSGTCPVPWMRRSSLRRCKCASALGTGGCDTVRAPPHSVPISTIWDGTVLLGVGWQR